MAPHRLPVVHRTGLLTTTVVVEHLVASVLVEITAAALHVPPVPRVALAIACLVSHWQIHRRRQ